MYPQSTAKPPCLYPRCTHVSWARGYCRNHYKPARERGLITKLAQRTPEERFWAKVDKTSSPHGCWIWTGGKSNGYGRFGLCGLSHASVPSHRVSWEWLQGPIPTGLEICHDCPGGDNPSCVNPDHLFLGTRRENAQDASRKGVLIGNRITDRTGEKHGNAKLTDAAVRAMRERYAAGGVTYFQLAAQYGVSFQVVALAVKRKTWRHVA